MVRFLQAHGCVILREGGRHTIMGNNDFEVAIPRHAHLKSGTVHAILKAAQISRSNWRQL